MSLFLSEYVFQRKPWVLDLVECQECGSRFFSYRYSRNECIRLYSNYRGERYFKARHSAEPWYSRKFNYLLGADAKEILVKKEMLASYIVNSGFYEKIKLKKGKILDFGGDRGQFIPDIPNTEKYCFELSDAEPISEVVKFSAFEQIINIKFDLILSSAVFEHLSEPEAELIKIKSLMEKNSLLYIEVPYEMYFVPDIMKAAWYGKYLELISKSRTLTIGVDFISVLLRIKADFVPVLGLVKQHEHINFFTKKGMKMMLERNGLKILKMDILRKFSPSGDSMILSCLSENI